MILKSELIAYAKKEGLSPHVIEKDYALGWLLAGISEKHELKNNWVFKGGTCLKKGYFERYRFSEDLDFTMISSEHINTEFLLKTFQTVSAWVYEQSGVLFPEEKIEFEMYQGPLGNLQCQGKLSYVGPLAHTSSRQWPRIKIDLTATELLVDPPELIKIHHPYSDVPKHGIHILSYSLAEIFAEKIRALGQRTRPRDLYDVINLFKLPNAAQQSQQVSSILKQKCSFKRIEVPSLESLEKNYLSCKIGWEDQLSHQVMTLESFESYWTQLPLIFKWLE